MRPDHSITREGFSKWGCFFSAFLLLLAVAGCASPPISHYNQGKAKLEAGDFEAAYRFFEDPTMGHEEDVERAMQANPQLLVAGLRTFSVEALNASIQRYGRSESFSIEQQRLKSFKRYGSPAQFVEAARNFERTFINPRPSTATLSSTAVTESDAASYAEQLSREGNKQANYVGIVIDVQLIDESRSGTALGAQLGGVYGQAAYLDSTKSRDYKATSQVTAGVAGAIVGGMLDKAPEKKIRVSYYVKTLGGDIRQFETIALSTSHLPIGACVEVASSSISMVNLTKCGTPVPSLRTSSQTSTPANDPLLTVEERLNQLKQLYDKSLIDEDVYLERQREILRQ